MRNPVKRWWFDLEMVDGVAVTPVAGINERDLDIEPHRSSPSAQKLAMFPPALQPPPGATLTEVFPIEREAGLRLYAEAESPDAARARVEASNS